MKHEKLQIKNKIKTLPKINTWIKIDCIFLVGLFNNLQFQKFLIKCNNQLQHRRMCLSETYFSMFFVRNKFYLDFFSKNRSAELWLKQAFIQFLELKRFTLPELLARQFDNKLVVNGVFLKSFFAFPLASPIASPLQTKIVLVQTNMFTENFLWKYRHDIYQPVYEELITVSQDLAAFEFQHLNKYLNYDKLYLWFLQPSSFILEDQLNSIWMQCWKIWKSQKSLDKFILNEFIFGSLMMLIIYKPIWPYVLAALHLVNYKFTVYFFDFYLMQLTDNFSSIELELFD